MIFVFIQKMAQTMLDINSIKLIKNSGKENSQIFRLDDNKHIKLYFSTVYKQHV